MTNFSGRYFERQYSIVVVGAILHFCLLQNDAHTYQLETQSSIYYNKKDSVLGWGQSTAPVPQSNGSKNRAKIFRLPNTTYNNIVTAYTYEYCTLIF